MLWRGAGRADAGRVRFRVVSCEPAEGGLPNSSTTVCYEGDPIERTVLQAVTILPLESSMPLLVAAGHAEARRVGDGAVTAPHG